MCPVFTDGGSMFKGVFSSVFCAECVGGVAVGALFAAVLFYSL